MPVIRSLISCRTSKAGLGLYISRGSQKVRFQQVGRQPPACESALVPRFFCSTRITLFSRPPLFFCKEAISVVLPSPGQGAGSAQPCGSRAELRAVCWELPRARGLCFIPFISLHCRSHDVIQRPGTGRRAIIQPAGERARAASLSLISNHVRLSGLGQDTFCYLLPSWKGRPCCRMMPA